MRHAVIMAGGAGKRLWPLSRRSRPKQLLPVLEGKCLLELAVERARQVFDNDKIWVITNAEYAELVAETIPDLPRERIVGEPQGRDTANAIALGAELLAATDPEATMAVFSADHVIRPVEKFAECVDLACNAAEEHPESLVTFGIRPSWPHTGLGYIHCGASLEDSVFRVKGFREKPDHQTARRYVESGQYFWNSGMFVWKVSAILDALEKNLPESKQKLEPVAEAVKQGKDYVPILEEVYPTLEKISIDFAVMEKSDDVLMVELNCEWIDVGSWPALENVTDTDEGGNVVIGEATIMDSFRNVVVTQDDHLLAVLGMDDCIVVHSEDATLVCSKSDAQRLKELVNYLEKKYEGKYL
ncbi:MAG: mannose-1-phosphate guanylyltransferase [Phycisphaerae bacterium]